jgi:hypothetical protein
VIRRGNIMWIKYTDSVNHPELKHGKKYCIRDDDGAESYARFVVYEGGEEVDFLCLRTGRSVGLTKFRELNKETDLNRTVANSAAVEMGERL